MEEFYTHAEFLELPPEIQQQIGLELDAKSLMELCASAKGIQGTICDDDVFWHRKYELDFPGERVSLWKSSYMQRTQRSILATVRTYKTDFLDTRYRIIFELIQRGFSNSRIDMTLSVADVKTMINHLSDDLGMGLYYSFGNPMFRIYQLTPDIDPLTIRIELLDEIVEESRMVGVEIYLHADTFFRILTVVEDMHAHQLEDQGKVVLYTNGENLFVRDENFGDPFDEDVWE